MTFNGGERLWLSVGFNLLETSSLHLVGFLYRHHHHLVDSISRFDDPVLEQKRTINLLVNRVSQKKLTRKAKETLQGTLATSGAGFVIGGGIETATMGKCTLNAILLQSLFLHLHFKSGGSWATHLATALALSSAAETWLS
jgi:hypothetical protein